MVGTGADRYGVVAAGTRTPSGRTEASIVILTTDRTNSHPR
jgi:hypothetical protein